MTTSFILVLVIITILFIFKHYALSKDNEIDALKAQLDLKKTNESDLLNNIVELSMELRKTKQKLIDTTVKLRNLEK
jgi:cell division protein FtsL